MSTIHTPYPMIIALRRTESFLGYNREWYPVNEQQRTFWEQYQAIKTLPGCTIEAHATIAETATVRRFMVEHGFRSPVPTAGINDVLLTTVQWLEPNLDCERHPAKIGTHPAVTLMEGVQMFQAANGRHTIFSLPVADECAWYIIPKWRAPENRPYQAVTELLDNMVAVTLPYDGITLPCVDLRQEIEHGWLEGMHMLDAHGEEAIISTAIQRTVLLLDHNGKKAIPNNAYPYVLNQPFTLVVTDHCCDMPLFVGHITREHWCRENRKHLK